MKNQVYKVLLLLFVTGAAIGCGKEPDYPVLSDKWLLLPNQTASIGTGDEYLISPTFSSEEVKGLQFVWTVSDPGVVSIAENNNSSIVILAENPGTATVKVECPGETKRLTGSMKIMVTKSALRILAIGNSFSQDAVEQYLWDLFNEAGIEVVIGNMYIGGCSLQRHWNNAESGSASYEYRKVVDGRKTNTKNVSLSTALSDENWDYISLQQASDYSGMYQEYEPYLGNLVEYVCERATNRNMKLMFHQTWAYSKDSGHSAFVNYGYDQMTMYEGITDASLKALENHPEIDFVIPSGTAIQNGRSSWIGDKFNRDGYHLNTDYGRFTAACTWYETISGESVLLNGWKPSGVSGEQAEVARNAAHFAVGKPFEVTDMSEF